MWGKGKGIVLSVIRHNDKSSIVHVFTDTHGYITFIHFTRSSSKGCVRNALLQPLTAIGFECRILETDSLQHFRDLYNLHPFTSIPFNPVKSSIALFLSEFLTYALKGESESSRLFPFLEDSLCRWDRMETSGNFHLYLTVRTAGFIGIAPDSSTYRPGHVLDMPDGIYKAGQEAGQDCLTSGLSYKMLLFQLCHTPEEAESVPMTGPERNALLNAVCSYYRRHIPAFPELKSLDILGTVFR